MMRRLLCLALVAASIVGAASASAQSIGLFFDPEAAAPSGNIAAGGHGTLYIVALQSGPTAAGVTGAEFRVTGLPADWFYSLTPNPGANIVLGDPFNGTGVNIVWPTCQTTPALVLFTVDLHAGSPVSDLHLRVESRNQPLNPFFPCPLVTLCDRPMYSIVCVAGGEAIVNPTGPNRTVAVRAGSWSSVKRLYD